MISLALRGERTQVEIEHYLLEFFTFKSVLWQLLVFDFKMIETVINFPLFLSWSNLSHHDSVRICGWFRLPNPANKHNFYYHVAKWLKVISKDKMARKILLYFGLFYNLAQFEPSYLPKQSELMMFPYIVFCFCHITSIVMFLMAFQTIKVFYYRHSVYS